MKSTSINAIYWISLSLLAASLMLSCKSNETTKASNIPRPHKDTVNYDIQLTVLRHLKLQLDTTSMPADTLMVNVCYQEDSLTADDLAYILAAGKNDSAYLSSHKLKTSPKRKAPCLGKYIEISGYQSVTRLTFSKDSSIIIIGKSMHDSQTSIDATLIKFGSNDYAYTAEHICGAIGIKYTKNVIAPHDILNAKGAEDTWHQFSNEQELLKQISMSPTRRQQSKHQ